MRACVRECVSACVCVRVCVCVCVSQCEPGDIRQQQNLLFSIHIIISNLY